MTYEEAILRIKNHNEVHQRKERFAVKITEALNLAITSLEKQIPKKLKKKEENQLTFYDCPCCGGYLMSKIDGELCCGQEYEYCYRCGQALDWSDTE